MAGISPATAPRLTAGALGALTALFLAGLPSEALAQRSANAQFQPPASNLARQSRPVLSGGRYVSAAGQAFVLDVSGPRPLLRFEQNGEVWSLRPTPAPRGDVIYRNDAGDQVLRVTPDGGMTVFTARSPGGAPVSRAGEAAPLQPPRITPVQMMNFIVAQSGRASRALGRLVVVDVLIEPGSEAVAADALTTAVDALIRMARSAQLSQASSGVRRVLVTDQGQSSVNFDGGTLRIVIDARAGYAGRPSSQRIVREVAERQ